MSHQSTEDPGIKTCECGICESVFTQDTVVAVAQAVARHWNEEHGDELQYSETAFDTIEYGSHHLHGDSYEVRRKDLFVTAYDVLNPDGDTPFKYEFVKKTEAQRVCEDCWRSITAVDDYRELSEGSWRTKYLCQECSDGRQTKRRATENHSVGEFA